jgi:toxin ParE1/3/4
MKSMVLLFYNVIDSIHISGLMYKGMGLGVEFLNELERQVLKIASLPTQWRGVEGDSRRALMQRFPYVIYYRILENDVLRVTLVKYQRRHPGYGLDRK